VTGSPTGAPPLPPGGDGEAALVRAAQAGAGEAFGRLYEAHHGAILGFLARRLRDPQEAEDLAQEALLKALEALPGYRWTGAPFRAWLLRVAWRTLVDASRRRARRPAVPFSSTPLGAAELPDRGPAGPAGPDPERWALEAERRRALAAAVARLTPLQRAGLTLTFVGGLTCAEAGRRLGRTENAVKALRAAGLRALRRHLEALA
jgi:RNA polymerase sigma-70 factor, ECF subfamily